MLQLTDSELLNAVHALRWPAQRSVRGGFMGAHVSRRLGPSAEFTEYRPYQQGDEIRRIDWKLMARTDRAYVRLAQDYSQLPTMLLVDASASMAYPARTQAKWVQARGVTLGLAAATHQSGDPVGVLVAQGREPDHEAQDGEAPRRLAARTRRGVVQQMARLLTGITPRGTVELAPLLLSERANARVVIVSDFLGDAEALIDVAGQLRARARELYAIHIIDVTEIDPDESERLLYDPEDPSVLRSMSKITRQGYQREFAQWREGLFHACASRGVVYTAVHTDEPVPLAVRRITRLGRAVDAPRSV